MNDRSIQYLTKITSGISFRKKVFAFIFGLLTLQLILVGSNFYVTLEQVLKDQVGTRALIQAKAIASDPELIKQVANDDQNKVGAIVERLAAISDASFIVVGDHRGIRLAHPLSARVGLPMQGGDNAGVLERGESYVSVRKGSLGYGVRGKTPVINSDGAIIGVVSVGYLLNRFDQWFIYYAKPFAFAVTTVFLLTLIGAWVFSNHIKRNMNGMEPSEITLALYLQKSILESVYEGVIAIDLNGRILALNKTSLPILGTQQKAEELKGKTVFDYISDVQFFFKTPYHENLKDEVVVLNGTKLIANRVAMIENNELIGWVVSFRNKDDINSLTAELTQVKQYTDNLRLLRHEHANKLSTISGLIEIKEYEAAQNLINRESLREQTFIDFVRTKIACKEVAAILLGKTIRARELGIDLQFDPTCQLKQLQADIEPNELAGVIGNLLDNAFEATFKNPQSNKVVSFLITDSGKDLVIEVADNGCGIDEEKLDQIFTRGYTNKTSAEGHGIGLYLINSYIKNAGGTVLVDHAEPKGAIFSVFIANNGK